MSYNKYNRNGFYISLKIANIIIIILSEYRSDDLKSVFVMDFASSMV